jgi:energy-coupling factor transporter ATP-binding protein EcfA2
MIRELTIKNYKSILDHTIELGRINVFIGENGCGKTNILEAMAMAAAALTDKLSVEELFNRGMRVAKPSIMRSSFPGATSEEIVIGCGLDTFDHDPDREDDGFELHISADESSLARVKWVEVEAPAKTVLPPIPEDLRGAKGDPLVGTAWLPYIQQAERVRARQSHAKLLGDFAIYNASTLALRGLQIVSRRTPLGIYGETLDYAISTLKPEVWDDILERARCISWLDDIVVDVADQLKYQGHKLAGSQSTLYFYDKFMSEKNNVFSAENVNEGILHILLYFTLFASEGTPKVLGIDNIDTALNPQLCRDLIKQIAELAVKHDKQALITTHNPAVLDGLNLHDDDQRLFVVARNDEGHTVTDRIKLKPKVEGAPFKYKLSEMWMRGIIGGLPETF